VKSLVTGGTGMLGAELLANLSKAVVVSRDCPRSHQRRVAAPGDQRRVHEGAWARRPPARVPPRSENCAGYRLRREERDL
jgi:nucleoside-diphosphate-sugar epimerase